MAYSANEILSEMKATLGFNNCWLMCINSGNSTDINSVGNDFWLSHALPALLSSSEKGVRIYF